MFIVTVTYLELCDHTLYLIAFIFQKYALIDFAFMRAWTKRMNRD